MHIGKSAFLIVILILFCTMQGIAQYTFTGRVLEDSTAKTPVYQATIAVTENNQPIGSVSTYFDGAFTIGVRAGKSYTLKISSPGLKDRQISFLTDKKGNADIAPPTIILIKDGLRLVGRVIDDKTNLPISRATVILKDVQTRSETYSTSGLDGMYNLKLNFETNYRVYVDKRSPGIFNQYEDTSFFISTVGFTMPLDYRLDIRLEKAEKLLPSYGEYEDPSQRIIKEKPIIDVKAINDSLMKLKAKNDSLIALSPTLKLEEPKAKGEQPSVKIDTAISITKGDKKEMKLAEAKLKAAQDSIERETKKAELIYTRRITDSLAANRQREDSIRKARPEIKKKTKKDKKAEEIREKIVADSIQKLKLQIELDKRTSFTDSLNRIRRTHDSIQLLKKADQRAKDSISRVAADYALKVKQAKNDSIIASKFTSNKAADRPKLTPAPPRSSLDSLKVTNVPVRQTRFDSIPKNQKPATQPVVNEKVLPQSVEKAKQDTIAKVKVATPATVVPSSAPAAKEAPATTPAGKSKSLGLVYFIKNNSGVTSFSKTKLKTIADQLKAMGNYTVSLEGYAGYEEDKQIDLSDQRAASVKQVLVQFGLDASKINMSANGFSKPLNDCHTTKDCPEQKMILNRRVELILK